MSIVLLGSTSGSITLSEPAVAGSTTLNLPATTGTVVVGSSAVSAAGQIPFSTDGSTYTPTAKIVSGTAVASTSGTSIDFTSIPSWVKRVTVIFNGTSTNSTTNYLLQIGSGSVTTSGYVSTASTNGAVQTSSTAGFVLTATQTAASGYYGHSVITLVNTSNTYVCSSNIAEYNSALRVTVSGGAVTLGGALDRVRITTVNGTDTFDAGSINILYE